MKEFYIKIKEVDKDRVLFRHFISKFNEIIKVTNPEIGFTGFFHGDFTFYGVMEQGSEFTYRCSKEEFIFKKGTLISLERAVDYLEGRDDLLDIPTSEKVTSNEMFKIY
jgi:hypothetical protein